MQTFSKSIDVPAISPGKKIQYSFDSIELKAGIRKYQYFNEMTVFNGNKYSDIEILFGFTKSYPIPAGATISLTDILYDSFDVVNNHISNSTIAGDIKIICSVKMQEGR